MTLEMPSFPLYYSILYNSTMRKIVHLFINISIDLYFTKSHIIHSHNRQYFLEYLKPSYYLVKQMLLTYLIFEPWS